MLLTLTPLPAGFLGAMPASSHSGAAEAEGFALRAPRSIRTRGPPNTVASSKDVALSTHLSTSS